MPTALPVLVQTGSLVLWITVLTCSLGALAAMAVRFSAIRSRLRQNQQSRGRTAEIMTEGIRRQADAIEDLLRKSDDQFVGRIDLMDMLHETRDSLRALLPPSQPDETPPT